MNLADILTRKNPMKRAFVALENDMDDVLNEEFMLPPETQAELAEAVQEEWGEPVVANPTETSAPAEETSPAEVNGERLTAHTQNRLADLAAFEEARINAQRYLEEIGSALANITSAHYRGRDFLNDCHADIRRANELEMAAGSLSSENRKLTDRVEKLEKLRGRYDQLIEVLKRREGKLLAENESLRESLAAAKLEAVEARNTISRAEFVQGELHTALAAKTSEAERFMRENELLREKNVNIALDLDKALQRQAETRRKFDDLSAIHTTESAMVAKMTAKLASEEKEAARLQKLADTLEAKLVEANESVANFTREMSEREELYQSENHALKSEIQSLMSRLQAGATDQTETAAELTALNTRLSELESEKLFAERKAAGQIADMENERMREASLHEQQVKEMRRKIDELTQTVDSLRRHEKMIEAAIPASRQPEALGSRGKAKPHRDKAAAPASAA
jgi:chromosome segregation ATPase